MDYREQEFHYCGKCTFFRKREDKTYVFTAWCSLHNFQVNEAVGICNDYEKWRR